MGMRREILKSQALREKWRVLNKFQYDRATER